MARKWHPKLHTLPDGVLVAERDWLSANHILLHGDTGRVIIDTGYISQAERTRACVEAAFGVFALDLIVNTHCHSDHIGCNAYLQRWTHAPIAMPIGDAHAVELWDEAALWLDWADQQCERFSAQQFLKPDEIYRWGNLEWRAISAPGHNDATLLFYNALHRILISADALWENGFGIVSPKKWDAHALDRTRAALDTMAALDVALVIPGHGAPFTNMRAALDKSYARLDALEADDHRIGRQIAKVMFIYSVLAKEKLRLTDLPDYSKRVPVLQRANEDFLHLEPTAYAQWLVDEAVKSGNARVEGDFIVAAGAH